MGRIRRTALFTLLVCAALTGRASAQQALTTSLFERYVDALRVQAGIPGISGVILQNGSVVWQAGLGLSNVEHGVQARADTPYQISGLTEMLSSTLLLEQCYETGHLALDDTIQERAIAAPNPTISIRDALTHRSATGTFKYDASRYTALTGVIEACQSKDLMPIRQAIAQKIFDRIGMTDSVPAANVGDASADDRTEFSPSKLSQYSGALARLATPYRVSGGSASVVTSVPQSVDAASGAISSALDLAKFDSDLDSGDVLHRDTMAEMWTNAVTAGGAPMPTGLGWFVQVYNGRAVYWQFGNTAGYSSIIIKVPSLRVTLILLANSDGLSAPFSLQDGDVTTSLFARTFLKLFVG